MNVQLLMKVLFTGGRELSISIADEKLEGMLFSLTGDEFISSPNIGMEVDLESFKNMLKMINEYLEKIEILESA